VSDSNFVIAMKFVLEHECRKKQDGTLDPSYTLNPADPGGETKFGIAKRAHPDLDIKNLTIDEALDVYMQDYWQAMGCNELETGLAVAVMDTAVNNGVGAARKFLQTTKQWNDYLNLRIQRYQEIVNKNPSQSVFFKGWLARVNDLKKYITLILQEAG
jgi:lysozyme family protein